MESQGLPDMHSPQKTGRPLVLFSGPNSGEGANNRDVREFPLRQRLTVSGRCPSQNCPRSDWVHNTSDLFQTYHQERNLQREVTEDFDEKVYPPDKAHYECTVSQGAYPEDIQHDPFFQFMLRLQLNNEVFVHFLYFKSISFFMNKMVLMLFTFSNSSCEIVLPLTLAALWISWMALFFLPWVKSQRADSGRILINT